MTSSELSLFVFWNLSSRSWLLCCNPCWRLDCLQAQSSCLDRLSWLLCHYLTYKAKSGFTKNGWHFLHTISCKKQPVFHINISYSTHPSIPCIWRGYEPEYCHYCRNWLFNKMIFIEVGLLLWFCSPVKVESVHLVVELSGMIS